MASTQEQLVECMEMAAMLKEEGNALFKEGKFQLALAKYTKVFLYVNGLNPPAHLTEGLDASVNKSAPPSSQQVSQIQALRSSANLNCATCYFKLNKLDKTLEFCQRALEVDPDNKKTVYRRAQAFLGKKDLDSAERDLKVALAAFPNDRGVQADCVELKRLLKEEAHKTPSLFAGIFDSNKYKESHNKETKQDESNSNVEKGTESKTTMPQTSDPHPASVSLATSGREGLSSTSFDPAHHHPAAL